MNIAITNIVALNGGDYAILRGMEKSLKSTYGDDLTINAFGPNPEKCNKLYPDFNWGNSLGLSATTTRFTGKKYIGRIAKYIKCYYYLLIAHLIRLGFGFSRHLVLQKDCDSFRRYAQSDVIISTGGTYITDTYGIDAQYYDYLISLALGKKLVFYTQSIGPIFRTKTSKRLRSIFNQSKLILLRDKKSESIVKQIVGNSQNVPIKVFPDAAFALGDIKYIQAKKQPIGSQKKIAFSVREWTAFRGKTAKDGMENYISSIRQVVIYLISVGYDVYFLSTCQGNCEYDDDSKLVETIINGLPTSCIKHIVKIDGYIALDRIITILKDMDMIVSTRLHMSILALISGTPVMPIAYEFKLTELFSSLGYNQILNINDITPDCLIKTIRSFILTYDKNLSESVKEKVISYITTSKKASELIKSTI